MILPGGTLYLLFNLFKWFQGSLSLIFHGRMARGRWPIGCQLGFPVLLQLYNFCGGCLMLSFNSTNLSVSFLLIAPFIGVDNSLYFSLSLFLYKGTDSSFLSAFFDVLSGIILCGMTIIAALMITLGFMVWCQNVTQRFPS